MNKIFIFPTLLILFLISIFVIFRNNLLIKDKTEPTKENKVSFFNKDGKMIADFKVEIASNTAQIAKGLMNRDFLAEDRGMLFTFRREKNLSFWMKNTLIPLDMIFISEDYKVISITANAQPCKVKRCPTYSSHKPAKYVLEVNGGLAEKLGIKEGIEVFFNYGVF